MSYKIFKTSKTKIPDKCSEVRYICICCKKNKIESKEEKYCQTCKDRLKDSKEQ